MEGEQRLLHLETLNTPQGRALSEMLREKGIEHVWTTIDDDGAGEGAPLPRIYTGRNTFYGENEVWGYLLHVHPQAFGITKEAIK